MDNVITRLLFPPKCVLCGRLLSDRQTDLCHDCRENAPIYNKGKFKLSFVAGWTAVWYYKDMVRKSLLRYKFYNRRGYAQTYGRMLAMKLQTDKLDHFDILSWIPVSSLRRLRRGYDQVELLAKAVAAEIGTQAVPTLKKVRNNPPQSRQGEISKRRANVLNAYKVPIPGTVAGKRILLLDDILTTGATASECARMLLTAGAKEVYFAAVAVASHDTKR